MRFLYRTLRTAVAALRRNVMRSALTTLGIVIGVGAVIAMVEIGDGASREVQAAIASMGSNTILVIPGNLAAAGVAGGSGTAMNLSPGDALAISDPERCNSLCAVAPFVSERGRRSWPTAATGCPDRINGTTPAYVQIRDWDRLSEGCMFSDQDVTGPAPRVMRRRPNRGRHEACSRDESPVGRRTADENNRSLLRSWACFPARAPTCTARTRTTSSSPRGRRSSLRSSDSPPRRRTRASRRQGRPVDSR